jgi:hypothetical protein
MRPSDAWTGDNLPPPPVQLIVLSLDTPSSARVVAG